MLLRPSARPPFPRTISRPRTSPRRARVGRTWSAPTGVARTTRRNKRLLVARRATRDGDPRWFPASLQQAGDAEEHDRRAGQERDLRPQIQERGLAPEPLQI